MEGQRRPFSGDEEAIVWRGEDEEREEFDRSRGECLESPVPSLSGVADAFSGADVPGLVDRVV